jgi:hypothetical protein
MHDPLGRPATDSAVAGLRLPLRIGGEVMAFPSKGDRVAHFQYGPGTITDLDVHHTVIDFDGFGSRRFVTSRVVLERTSDPGPTAAERKAVDAERSKAARAAKKAAAPPKKKATAKSAEKSADA